MDTELMKNRAAAGPGSKRVWRRAVITTSVLGGMLLSGIAILPSAVMSSSHRDRVLNLQFGKLGLTATSGSGSGGWLTAFTFNDIVLADESGQVNCTIESLRTSEPLLRLLTGPRDLGRITIVQPDLKVALDDDGKLPLKRPKKDPAAKKWDVALDLQDASFAVSVPWRKLPIVELAHLDISCGVTTEKDGRWLTTEPIEIFNHESLSSAHTEQNLALIAPVLSQATELSGDVSVRLEGLRARLEDDNASWLPIHGTATFHTVEARLKKEWVLQVSQLMGLTTGPTVANRLQIVRESTVDFEVSQKGIYHHGLAFLLPDLAASLQIESSGHVGLDECLDLALSIQLPQLLSRGPVMDLLAKMVRGPLQLSVKGTVSEPKLVTPPGLSVMDQLAGNLSAQNQATPPPTVQSAVIKLIGLAASPAASGESDTTEEITSGILNIIRAAKAAKKAAPAKDAAAKESRPKIRRKRNDQ